MTEGIVKIHGKDYKTVAHRISEFRTNDRFADWCIKTKVVSSEAGAVTIKASILDKDGALKATGIAYEVEGSTNINKTSHVENCETSAIGRALACLGLAGTDSYASADEVANAISNQAVKDATERLITHNKMVAIHLESILAIKTGINTGELSVASEAWFELSKEEMAALWLAPTAGGIFTTKERDVMKSSEFRQSHFGEDE